MSLPRNTLLLMSFSTGLTVANLYYNQPLLDAIKASFGVGFAEVGWVPTLTQAGYALGMLFLVPLGDRFNRKKLVLIFTLLSAVVSLILGLSQHFALALVASLALGLTSLTPQFLIPFAAQLADPKNKGRVVGTMMSGLLLGILLARTVSGFVGAAWGWRSMFLLAAGVLLVLSLIMAKQLPSSHAAYKGSYAGLLRSVWEIFRAEPVLREAAFFGMMLFAAFSAFWATLIHLMESPAFQLGSRAVGIFGILGAVAAFTSPMIGGLMDRTSPRRATGLMILLTLLSFGIYAVSGSSLIGLGLGVILMDIGVQGGHLSNQTRIFALRPDSQSRIQTAYMFCYFVGGAAGSFLGNWAWAHYQWWGVCGSAIGMLLIALGRFVMKPAVKTV